ncbi:hypothetical protein [Cysteiniphilum sp. QT6929]|uniref:WD40/YVTN/BNR-like repeat-containing protein n=1 Tax=Cysteiniphilum sp. QT6929 TaxID=2975055 RepID=UPI0024B33DC6|nr:hypothetical protein [Cysteiniphilum sp. QT6929]WHN65295.1 hypothetical protein NYP54_09635 [Cysteiniphilum sp. QT6929]
MNKMKKLTAFMCVSLGILGGVSASAAVKWDTAKGGKISHVNATLNALYVTTSDGISISQDDGANWSEIAFSDISTSVYTINHIASFQQNIYVATNAGLFVSSDFGANWKLFSGLGSIGISRVHVTSSVDFYVVTSVGGVKISNDGGENWRSVGSRQGLGDQDIIEYYPDVLNNLEYVSSQATGNVWICSNGKFCEKMLKKPNALIKSFSVDVNAIYGASDGGLYVSEYRKLKPNEKYDIEWVRKDTTNGLPSNYITSVFAKNGQVIVSTDAGVAISNNLGNNWQYYTEANGLGSSQINDVSMLSGVAYAATEDGLSISSDVLERFVQYKDTHCKLDLQTGLIWSDFYHHSQTNDHKTNMGIYSRVYTYNYDLGSNEEMCGLTGWRVSSKNAINNLILGWDEGRYIGIKDYLKSKGFFSLGNVDLDSQFLGSLNSYLDVESGYINYENLPLITLFTLQEGVWIFSDESDRSHWLLANEVNVPDSVRPIVAIGSTPIEIEEGKSLKITGSKAKPAKKGRIIDLYYWSSSSITDYKKQKNQIDDPFLLEPTFTAPAYSIKYDNEYRLTLSATDNYGVVGRDTVIFKVIPNNDLLEVSADNGRELTKGELGSLKATANGGNEPYQYSWSSNDGIAIVHSNESPGEASFIAPDYKEGQSNEYTFTVMVTDAVGRKQTKTVAYTVSADPGLAPIAHAVEIA